MAGESFFQAMDENAGASPLRQSRFARDFIDLKKLIDRGKRGRFREQIAGRQ